MGKTSSGAGFGGKAHKTPEEQVDALIQLFERCRAVVEKNRLIERKGRLRSPAALPDSCYFLLRPFSLAPPFFLGRLFGSRFLRCLLGRRFLGGRFLGGRFLCWSLFRPQPSWRELSWRQPSWQRAFLAAAFFAGAFFAAAAFLGADAFFTGFLAGGGSGAAAGAAGTATASAPPRSVSSSSSSSIP